MLDYIFPRLFTYIYTGIETVKSLKMMVYLHENGDNYLKSVNLIQINNEYNCGIMWTNINRKLERITTCGAFLL